MFLKKGGVIFIMSMFLVIFGYSNIGAKTLLIPIADAGVDGSVCSSSTHQLVGSVTNATLISWQTLGDGTFSNSAITNPVYTPGANDISSGTVSLILSASDGSVTVTDTMTLIIIAAVTANAGLDATICAGDSYALNSSTNTGTTFIWLSLGNGFFSNPLILNPTYTPGNNDINLGSVTLLLVCSNSYCQAVQDMMILTINPLSILAPISHN